MIPLYICNILLNRVEDKKRNESLNNGVEIINRRKE